MKEFTCIYCGTKGIDKSNVGNKMYCSKRCREKHRAEDMLPCKFNEGVLCDRHKCSTCGWNPEVEQRRKGKLLNG